MGTTAHLIVVGPARLTGRGRRRIEALEQRWSRFRPTSELNRLNARAGEVTRVSEETRLLVQRSLEGWWLSGGAFDPTLLGDVVRAGYDRTYEEIGPRERQPISHFRSGCDGIVLEGHDVHLPPDVGIDSGGIGKGLAADLVAAELMDAGADGVCCNIGGDLRVVGVGPDPGGWTIAVEHAWNGAVPLALVGLAAGGMATSTTLKRRWLVDGELRHHLIDPRSHRPAESGLNHATVVAGEAWRAEILAKAVLVNGEEHPFDIVGGTGSDVIAVTEDGKVLATEGFSRYVGATPLPRRVAGGRGPGPAP